MNNKKGFTLVEILTVVAIIGILALIILPNFISSFQNASTKAMITQENQVVDAARLFLEDYCRNPLMENKGKCTMYSLYTNDSSKKYTCLKTLQDTKYIDDITFKSQYCSGFVVYENNFKGYKSYLKCGDSYETKNTSTFKDQNGNKIIDVCLGQVGSVPTSSTTTTTTTTNTTTQALQGTLMHTVLGSTVLRTNIARDKFETITFTNSIAGRSPNGTNTFDASTEANGSVLSWIADSDNDGLYELTIGSNGKVYLEDGNYFFSDFSNLTNIYGMQYLDTSKVVNMEGMFRNCTSLKELDLSHFNTSKVNTMNYIFFNCSSLTSLDLSSFDLSSLTYFESIFSNCRSLTSVNVSTLDTSRIKSFNSLFSNCRSLTTIDLSNFNTSNVESMVGMFEYCESLTSIDLSNFDTSSLKGISLMFTGCKSLTTIDLSNFDTSRSTMIVDIFKDCTNLRTVDLSSFDTKNVTDMRDFFNGCENLKTIYVSGKFDTSNVTQSNRMFKNCGKIVGGSGTTFSSSHTDASYAHIDGGTSNPGYFTRK